jgi:hypothetical protein
MPLNIPVILGLVIAGSLIATIVIMAYDALRRN